VLFAADGSPRVADLGLVPLLEAVCGPLPLPSVARLAYRAPELKRPGVSVSPQADIYALGAILQECLADRPPPAIKKICQKCLHPQPRRRYGTAALLADDLAGFVP
jgi:serine/threonine-protein kinase